MSTLEQDAVPTLAVRDLDVAYTVKGRQRTVLRGLSFDIAAGQTYGLVGESGCGKSTAAMAIVRHLAANARVRNGAIRLNDVDVLGMNREQLRRMRALDVSMVYQEPGRALNPSMPIADQLGEVFVLAGRSREQARADSRTILTRVQISSPDRVLDAYPHQLSGGMQQRVVIAMALATNPSLLILDEPTTALDATVGAEVLDIVAGLSRELGTSVLLIAHNLALVRQMCDRVGVLYAGVLVDEGPAQQVFEDPRHPYTAGLLQCIPGPQHQKHTARLVAIPGALPAPDDPAVGCLYSPRCALADDHCRTEEPPAFDLGGRHSRCFHHERAGEVGEPDEQSAGTPPPVVDYDAEPVMVLDHASKTYGRGEHAFHALNDVSLSLWRGETLGVVGESGSGKTTLAHLAMGLAPPDPGANLTVDGQRVRHSRGQRDLAEARAIQIVFQNPDAALNRRHAVRRIIGRSIAKLAGLRGAALRERLGQLGRDFKLGPQHMAMRPLRLSGGLKQRVAIARAFAGEPTVVLCDEPTSALDVSVQASILNLLVDLQVNQGVAYLFVSHDLAVVQYMSDRIVVMYLGQVMEVGPAARVVDGPHHPYTEVLLSAVPTMDGRPAQRVHLRGDPPDSRHPPTGCPFQNRCPRKIGAICEEELPALRVLDEGHSVRCHLPEGELPRAGAAAPARPQVAPPRSARLAKQER